jgi:ABC-type transport system substrate-binding protein
MAGWGGSAAPSDPFQLWHSSSWVNKGSNFTGFGDAESDSLIELSNRKIDPEERKEVMWKLQEKVYDEQPYIFMYSTKRKIVIHRRFDNANMYYERPGVILNNLKLSASFAEQAEPAE